MPHADPTRCYASEERDDNADRPWEFFARREEDIGLYMIVKLLRQTHLPQPDRLAAYEAELKRRKLPYPSP
jgi:hypothetical protein